MTTTATPAAGEAVSRRAFLTCVPAVAAAAMLPAVALSAPTLGSFDEDPILPLYREWLSARAEWRHWADAPGNEDWDFPESIAAEDREIAARDRMLEMAPTTFAGVSALLHATWVAIGPNLIPGTPDYLEEIKMYGVTELAAVWRAVTGLEGNPDDFEGLPEYYARWRG